MSNNDWYKVDNVAKVFLATQNDRDTRTLRVSITLKEPIEPDVLQEALDQTIKVRPQFQVRIRRGLFWHYIERTDVQPIVTEESDRPCPVLYGKHFRDILHYKVTYLDNKINLDLFHALSDGTGALDFINVLTLNYLKLLHPEALRDVAIPSNSSQTERERNSYEQFYDKENKAEFKNKMPKEEKACQIHGRKLPFDQLQFFELHMSAAQVLAKSRSYEVSLTSYISTLLMLAIHDDISWNQKKLPVAISMPVNLRNYYNSNTARNFFNNITIRHHFDGTETVASLAKEFQKELKEATSKERIQAQMNSFAGFEHLFFARAVPLIIKNPVVRSISNRRAKSVSAVVSGLGVQKVPEEMRPFIQSYAGYCSYDGLFTTISTYEDDLVMGMSSAYSNTSVLRNFIRRLREDDIDVALFASEVVH